MAEAARILIADDDPSFLLVASRFLTSHGYVCSAMPDGDAARAEMESSSFDLLISDIEMPGNNDLALIRWAADNRPGLPVILVTGYPSVDSAVASHNLPVFAYLMKPISFPELARQAHRATGQYQVFKAIQIMETRLSAWANDLAQLRVGIQSYSTGVYETNVRGYVSVTFNTMIGALTELKNIFDYTRPDDHETNICRVDTCPLKQQFEAAMEDAIETLRNTKGAFKSKEIGELRKRFERVLEEQRERLSKPLQP
jgi:CheY-like chemotaxis protein